jgi:hypothetical protein
MGCAGIIQPVCPCKHSDILYIARPNGHQKLDNGSIKEEEINQEELLDSHSPPQEPCKEIEHCSTHSNYCQVFVFAIS